MNIPKILITISALALLPIQSWAQDTSARNLQGWLDFLVPDATMPSIVSRIGPADAEKSVDYLAPNARLYIWNNKFYNGTTEGARLELVTVSDNDPLGAHQIAIAIIDPNRGRGIYLPWARRFVDNVPAENHIRHTFVAEMLGY
jgi:hypothetical protein